MLSGVQPEDLDFQVNCIFKELAGHFDIVTSMFSPALKCHAKESCKWLCSSEMSDFAKQLATLVQSQQEELTPKAKKVTGPLRSTHAKLILPIAKELQAEKEEAKEESEPQHRKPHTVSMTMSCHNVPDGAVATKSKCCQGKVLPQTTANGVLPEEHNLDKVVSNTITIDDTLLILGCLSVQLLPALETQAHRVSPSQGHAQV